MEDWIDSFLRDLFGDPNEGPSPEEILRQFPPERVRAVLANLQPRERRLMELRFGLVDGRQRTRAELAQEFGITRERTRQIEAKILHKLRHQGLDDGALSSV